MIERLTIEQLRQMRESEDRVEFKSGEGGNVSYNGAGKEKLSERRRCILGYVSALCNEGGGHLVIGMHDKYPHKVTGTQQSEGAIGQLESNIYRDLSIRPNIYELFEDGTGKRVLVIQVPPRPIGKVFKYEDVALMRVGEELKPMDDKTYLSIIQEQEPDFSQKICQEASFDDLDTEAIEIMKRHYARKQTNPAFINIDNKQALSDLGLLVGGSKVTNAAVLLVGKEEFIQKIFPQAKVMLEYRNNESQINFDSRKPFGQPFYKMIDHLWTEINLRNGNVPVRVGAYIFDIPFFNEDVIREALNNAIAHRSYGLEGEIIIKQYPMKMEILNPGGLPHGVTIENLLKVPSTPRNRLLADVLSKTGIVERSGQGVDKIFLNTLSEGKPLPDYSESDDFFVKLTLSSNVEEVGFSLFIKSIQQELPDDKKLTVFDVLVFKDIIEGLEPRDKERAKRLFNSGYLEKRGKTKGQKYILSRRYYEMCGDMVTYSSLTDWGEEQMLLILFPYLEKYKKVTRKEINQLFGNHVSDRQIRSFLDNLKGNGLIVTKGENRWTEYCLSKDFDKFPDFIQRVVTMGLAEMKKRGELLNGRENVGEKTE